MVVAVSVAVRVAVRVAEHVAVDVRMCENLKAPRDKWVLQSVLQYVLL